MISDISETIELLAGLLEEAEFIPASTIPTRLDGDEVPLSFGQERMWFLEQLKPGTATYHIVGAFQLQGTLHAAALEWSLQAIVQRHDVLRTALHTVDGQAVLTVAPFAQVVLPLVDLRDWPAAARWEQAQQIIQAEAMAPFDLGQSPLLRLKLLRLADEHYVLVLCIHHIIADGWSLGVFFQELAALYRAYPDATDAGLPELPIQYADFAHWQRQWLHGEALEQQLAYWTEQLQGSSLVLTLPTDRPRPAVQSWRGAHMPLTLPVALTRELKAVGHRQQATLFMTLLAGFETLLYRYTDQSDIIVGTPIANRHWPEVEGLIGLFVNTVVLRNNLSGDLRFDALLAQVRETTLGAYTHQDLPFDLLVKHLRPDHTMDHTPLFQVVFVFQNTPDASLALPSLVATPIPVETGTAKFDLTLTLEERADGLKGMIEYNTDLFEPVTIARMIGHYQTLLEGIVADPAQRLADLPLLSTAERYQLTPVSNIAALTPMANLGLHGLFERQAQRTPDERAVTYEDQSLTYAQLNQRANQLARHLRGYGVGPDVPVALCLERSLDLVVAILAVLKAGGAYVPLDLAYPKERLAFMLADAQPPVLLTTSHLRDRIPAEQSQIVCLDTDWPAIARQSQFNLANRTHPANTAYIIYTSGSTGKPKGVMISHAQAIRLFEETQPWYQFNEQDVWTLFHSYAFDFSVWELWGALLYGGRLVVVPFEVSRTPSRFYELLRDEQVTVLNQTPSAFRQLIAAEQEAARDADALNLRLVIFGGEALELQSLRPWFERHGDQRPQLVNMYGITETTVHVTYRPITSADLQLAQASPIGQPIPDLHMYVLDRYLNLVPLGVPGELYVGGAGLARGYLNRPELTAQRFIPNPFSRLAGARLYKTGDLARYRADGQLEYLGRCDDQVKVRGFRIELGDIEAALLEHPAVREALTVAQTDQRGDKQLVAYIVLHQETDLNISALRDFLQVRIPEYMVPAAFVLLPHLPLTPNGKVDRAALPQPGTDRPELAAQYVAPVTLVQKTLAQVWSEVLGIEQIGIHDNFFALGGDSIRSVRTLALARGRGLHFSLEQFFYAQTIADLSPVIEQVADQEPARQVDQPFSLVTDTDRQRLPGGIEDAYPLSMLQAGMLYHMALTTTNPVYHNVDSFQLNAPLDATSLRDAIQTVVARHPILRTSFDLTSYSEPLQLVHPHAILPLTVEDIRHLAVEEQETAIQALVQIEKQRPFDLARPPLIRFHIYRRTDDAFQFTLTECHAIFDGWSLTSTLAEIFERYAALLDQKPLPPAEPLPTSFRDFIRLEREAIESRACQEYWSSQLHDASPVQLPQRFTPYTGSPEARMHAHVVAIPLDIFDGLNRLVQTSGVPLKSILLAAHLKVMSLMSGQSDITIGMTFNGRPEEQGGDQVRGLFLNTLPLRMRLVDSTWMELVQAAFATERAILPFRRYPLAMLQQQWGKQVLVPITFNFVHFHALDGLAGQGLIQLQELSHSSNENHFALAVSFSLNQLFWAENRPLSLFLQHDRAEFSEDQIAALGRYYVATLGAIVGDPSGSHARFSPLASAEQAQLLVEWNQTARPYPADQSLAALFAAQVARSPDAVALVLPPASSGGPTLEISYRELDARANQLAHALQHHGVGTETLVAVYLERSIELLVALLGILKAGGAYVPLDAAAPPERLAVMLEDTQAPLILTHTSLAQRLPGSTAQMLCLDQAGPSLARYPIEAPICASGPDHLAYVIYTSGSTGRPKGVAVPQRAVARLVHATNYARFGPEETFLLLAPASFDAATLEIWGSLLHGSRLVLFPGTHPDPLTIANIVQSQDVTTMWLTAGLFHLLVDLGLHELGTLRQLLAGGEALSVAHVARAQELWPQTQLINGYGPTENTTFSCCYAVPRAQSWGASIPIGQPIGHSQAYVLDANLAPVPTGVTGELYVGGDGLARGYLNRPELTAERFIPNPFATTTPSTRLRAGDDPFDTAQGRRQPTTDGAEDRGWKIEDGSLDTSEKRSSILYPPSSKEDGGRGTIYCARTVVGGRLYRTGDLARWLPDGTIEFLGRRDTQVKLRGFRIELGEIEHTLTRHPNIASAAVVVRVIEGVEQLVAYIVPHQEPRTKNQEPEDPAGGSRSGTLWVVLGSGVGSGELRAFLKEQLPEYMVPAQYVVLDALPLTRNGKVDRQALPEPVAEPLERASMYVAPESALERTIAAVWQDCLRCEQIGLHDNFFELGGHSLLMIQTHSRLCEALKRDFSIVEMFRCPTVSSLAAALSQASDEPPAAPADHLEDKLHDGKQRLRRLQQKQRAKKAPKTF